MRMVPILVRAFIKWRFKEEEFIKRFFFWNLFLYIYNLGIPYLRQPLFFKPHCQSGYLSCLKEFGNSDLTAKSRITTQQWSKSAVGWRVFTLGSLLANSSHKRHRNIWQEGWGTGWEDTGEEGRGLQRLEPPMPGDVHPAGAMAKAEGCCTVAEKQAYYRMLCVLAKERGISSHNCIF